MSKKTKSETSLEDLFKKDENSQPPTDENILGRGISGSILTGGALDSLRISPDKNEPKKSGSSTGNNPPKSGDGFEENKP